MKFTVLIGHIDYLDLAMTDDEAFKKSKDLHRDQVSEFEKFKIELNMERVEKSFLLARRQGTSRKKEFWNIYIFDHIIAKSLTFKARAGKQMFVAEIAYFNLHDPPERFFHPFDILPRIEPSTKALGNEITIISGENFQVDPESGIIG